MPDQSSLSAVCLFLPSLPVGIGPIRFKRRKDEWNGPCPIHPSKSNQTCFSYNDSDKFHCFSRSAKGAGAIDLAKLILKIGFKEACERPAMVKHYRINMQSPYEKKRYRSSTAWR